MKKITIIDKILIFLRAQTINYVNWGESDFAVSRKILAGLWLCGCVVWILAHEQAVGCQEKGHCSVWRAIMRSIYFKIV